MHQTNDRKFRIPSEIGASRNDAIDAARPGGDKAWSPKVDLREALDRDWVEIWYQPKIDLHGPGIVGAEGLARVRHPEHGIVPPAGFILEASGPDLIALAEHSLRIALQDTASFAAAGFPIRLSINVPIEALQKLPIPAIVREFRPDDDDWTGIILEVTEGQVIRDIAAAYDLATELQNHRIALAIDDFGRGHFWLGRLKDLPFAELKIDRQFVTGSGSDLTNAVLCKTVVDLAHRFGSAAVAEGVETVADLATVRHIGCDVAQGFLFARAMPKDMLLARLVANGIGGGFASTLASSIGDEFRATA